jgi:K+-transporting ATPase KdpF subunit
MRASSRASEEAKMLEILIGLAVALALGGYLVVTLIAPERF